MSLISSDFPQNHKLLYLKINYIPCPQSHAKFFVSQVLNYSTSPGSSPYPSSIGPAEGSTLRARYRTSPSVFNSPGSKEDYMEDLKSLERFLRTEEEKSHRSQLGTNDMAALKTPRSKYRSWTYWNDKTGTLLKGVQRLCLLTTVQRFGTTTAPWETTPRAWGSSCISQHAALRPLRLTRMKLTWAPSRLQKRSDALQCQFTGCFGAQLKRTMSNCIMFGYCVGLGPDY